MVTYNAQSFFTGDGVTKVFNFGFLYISKEHVKIQVDGTDLEQGTDYSITDESATLISAPSTGASIRIYRETTTDSILKWADGNYLIASDMNLEQLQYLYILQELKDYLTENTTDLTDLVDQARESAESAAVSQQAATTSASNAATVVSNVAVSESNAAASQQAAANSAIEAAQSAAEAEVSAQAVSPSAYDSATTYNFPDVVAYTDGYTYRCIGTNVTGEDPSTSSNWARITTVYGDFFDTDINEDLMPASSPQYSNDFDLDSNGDIMPKE